jgi:hypothetical protein
MNWAWANTLDQLWRSSAFPMWLTLAAAGFFAVIVLITLLRAEKSVANGALTVITLLAVGIALAATIRGFGSSSASAPEDITPSTIEASLPALACVDDLAGEAVLTACEKAVFGSPEATAAALSYAARQITRLTAFGDVVAANKRMTPGLEALRRAVEHDRYGLMAEVLVARDHCTPSDCAAFRSLIDRSRITTNIEGHTYDAMIARYSPLWNAPPAVAAVAPLVPGVPTGRPTNAEFPSASSTPPVSIMTAEPPAAASRQAATSAGAPAPPKPSVPPAVAAAKKQPAAPKAAAHTPPPAPATSLAPTAPAVSPD